MWKKHQKLTSSYNANIKHPDVFICVFKLSLGKWFQNFWCWWSKIGHICGFKTTSKYHHLYSVSAGGPNVNVCVIVRLRCKQGNSVREWSKQKHDSFFLFKQKEFGLCRNKQHFATGYSSPRKELKLNKKKKKIKKEKREKNEKMISISLHPESPPPAQRMQALLTESKGTLGNSS